ncbi:hypothetical protein [Anaplasma phagocytophilum]|uniref:hypothetical protein n=1 Tax=Anaplasma phagocytophilum TaxID=948 RepID=UPI0031F7AE20
MAYDVVTGQTDKLAAALAKINGKDIVHFAKAVEISHPIIDGKVCSGTHAKINGDTASTTYAVDPGTTTTKTAQCSGFGGTAGAGQALLSTFVSAVGLVDGKNWPTGQTGNSTAAKIGPTNSNATAVAQDLTKLTTEEKTTEWTFNISGL